MDFLFSSVPCRALWASVGEDVSPWPRAGSAPSAAPRPLLAGPSLLRPQQGWTPAAAPPAS